jgi:predicted O-linked N-acetylglucosamine transferase (SPINDLY family)
MKSIDHVVVDRFINPPRPELFVERPLVMPNGWLCFAQDEFFASQDVLETLPLERNGRLTFGTLNAPYKFSKHMVAAWARIMCAVPDSRLLFVRAEARSAAFVRNLSQEFERNGVARDRIEFFDNVAAEIPHLQAYNDIDMSLDTFPLTGGTTTVEALWMGVPVVSLVGESMHQRISYSALMHCGLPELCTFDEDGFVATAVALAQDRERLAAYRRTIRQKMLASPLCDGPGFAHDFMAAMESIAR